MKLADIPAHVAQPRDQAQLDEWEAAYQRLVTQPSFWLGFAPIYRSTAAAQMNSGMPLGYNEWRTVGAGLASGYQPSAIATVLQAPPYVAPVAAAAPKTMTPAEAKKHLTSSEYRAFMATWRHEHPSE